MGSWICTDPDCAQYCRQNDDFSWSYIEARELFDGHWAVSYAIVDLRDYSLDELWSYCGQYYNSFEQIIEDYGFRKGLQIMSECVFEQLVFDEMEFNAEQKNLGTAIKFIHKWMNGQ